MNNVTLNISNVNGVATMSSLEMVDYLNSLRVGDKGLLAHDNFVAKVKKVLPVTHHSFERRVNYEGHNGQQRQRVIYDFPEREATLLAMSYSYELQAAVLDAWNAVKNQQPVLHTFNIPTTLSGALMLASQQAETIEKQTLQIEQQAPAVKFHDAVVADDAIYPVGDAAKILGIGPRKFFAWLRDRGYLRSNNTPYASAAKFLESAFMSYVKKDGTITPPTTYVTSAGLAHFQGKLEREAYYA